MPISNLVFKRAGWRLTSALMCCMVAVASLSAQTVQRILPAHVPMPDNSKIPLLIQTHIAALSHANLTGNYAILHALGSPAFQSLNSPAQLAEKFAAFRMQGIDIGPAILLPPILSGPPSLE